MQNIFVSVKNKTVKLPKEYCKNETTDVFETVLFISEISNNFKKKLYVKRDSTALAIVAYQWDLDLKRNLHFKIAKGILKNSILKN